MIMLVAETGRTALETMSGVTVTEKGNATSELVSKLHWVLDFASSYAGMRRS